MLHVLNIFHTNTWKSGTGRLVLFCQPGILSEINLGQPGFYNDTLLQDQNKTRDKRKEERKAKREIVYIIVMFIKSHNKVLNYFKHHSKFLIVFNLQSLLFFYCCLFFEIVFKFPSFCKAILLSFKRRVSFYINGCCMHTCISMHVYIFKHNLLRPYNLPCVCFQG